MGATDEITIESLQDRFGLENVQAAVKYLEDLLWIESLRGPVESGDSVLLHLQRLLGNGI